jgi:hypothetical protein
MNRQDAFTLSSSEELLLLNRELEFATPEEILRRAITLYAPRLALATAFGAEGAIGDAGPDRPAR